jgi:hypothetical protein
VHVHDERRVRTDARHARDEAGPDRVGVHDVRLDGGRGLTQSGRRTQDVARGERRVHRMQPEAPRRPRELDHGRPQLPDHVGERSFGAHHRRVDVLRKAGDQIEQRALGAADEAGVVEVEDVHGPAEDGSRTAGSLTISRYMASHASATRSHVK